MSKKPDPNCEECHGDPNGVLGLHFYTPCTTCNHLRMSGGAKDRATYDLRQELEKEKKRVVVPDDVVHQSSLKSACVAYYADQMRRGAWKLEGRNER